MPDFLTLGASLDQKNAFLWSKVVFKNEETKLKSKYCHDDFDNWTNLEWRKLTLTITNNRVLVILVIESPKPTNSLRNSYFCFGRNETLVPPCKYFEESAAREQPINWKSLIVVCIACIFVKATHHFVHFLSCLLLKLYHSSFIQ